MPARVVVIGPGAIGTVLAAYLHRGGCRVVLAARDETRAHELEERGLTLIDGQGPKTLRLPAVSVATREPPEADFACICVKAHATVAVARAGAHLLRAASSVVSMQNGHGNAEALRGVATALVGAPPGFGATRIASGETRLAGIGPTYVAPITADAAPDAQAWVQLLQACGLPSQYHASFESVCWSKLVLNAGINAVTTIHGVTNGAVPATDELWEIALAAALEAADVARAQNIALLYTDVADELRRICRATALNRSSMLQDVGNHRGTEIDAINGAVVALGKQWNIPTPTNAALTDAVRALSQQ